MSRDYLTIRLIPKEKELKTKYRGFGAMTYPLRIKNQLQEKHVQDYLHKYSDEQAMTLSELSLCKKLYQFTKLDVLYPGYKIFKICIDVTGWNHILRAETVHPVLRHKFDKIYDTMLGQRTNNTYENALIYVPDERKPCVWEGQLGGIEGLNQHSWVVVYLAQLKYAFRDLEESDIIFYAKETISE